MKKERGIIGLLVVLIVGLILAKYLLNWSIFTAVETPQGQETVSYTHELLVSIWHYISTPIIFVWDKVQSLIHWGQNSVSNLPPETQ